MFRSRTRSLATALSLVALWGCGGVENVGESPDAQDEGEVAASEGEATNPLLRADTDGNGVVTKAEFQAAHAARFDAADADKSGLVSGDELAALRPEGHGKHRGKGPDGKGRPGKMDPEARFAEADADKDGALVKSEVEAQAATHFAELDKNADGKLADDERPFKRGPMAADGDVDKATFVAKAWEMIAHADADKDGKVTRDELRAAGPKMGRGGKGKMMEKIDADGDGSVSKAEFVAMGDKMWSRLDADGSGSLVATELDRGKRPHGKGRRER